MYTIAATAITITRRVDSITEPCFRVIQTPAAAIQNITTAANPSSDVDKELTFNI
jgi:hypothetical protein